MAYPTNALIVDDEAHVRAFFRLMLKEIGIDTIHEAGDGAAAIQMAQQKSPGLVLLDINMPVMNGLEILEQLMQIDATIPVVMITSQGSIATVQEAVRLGAVGYMLKQSPREQTQKALREVLESLEAEPESE